MRLPALYTLVTLLVLVPTSFSRQHFHLIRSFTCDFQEISLPSAFFTSGTAENAHAKAEIQRQLQTFMSDYVGHVLGVLVNDIAPGKLIANVTVSIDWTLNDDASGELSKAMLDLGQHDVTVNGSTSSNNTVSYNGVVITNGDISVCDVRRLVDHCYDYQVCSVDQGVPMCENKDMSRLNKYIIIGVVCGVAAIVIVVARHVWMKRTERDDSYLI